MKVEKEVTITLEMTLMEATALAAMSTVVHDYLFGNPGDGDILEADIKTAGHSGTYDLAHVLADLLPAFRRVDINLDALRSRIRSTPRGISNEQDGNEPDEAFERGAGLGN